MKASGRQIASRYVKALFDLAATPEARAQVENDFTALTALHAESHEFRDVLASPIFTREQQEKAIATVLGAIKAQDATRQFLAMLARQKRLALLPEIMQIFAQRASAARGELTAEITSAIALSPQDIATVSERLSAAYGQKIIVETQVNPELLGGMIVKIGSVQLDSSLAGKMRRLSLALKAA